jgi:DNA (cytosine-5)-methyltransferase 1
LGKRGYFVVKSAVSLFSGCGGFDEGFTTGGFRVVEAHDLDPVAIGTYNANHTPVGHVTDLSNCSIDLPKADIVIAGPPCQGFSTIGNLRRDDERNSLLMSACRIVAKHRPKLLILENVMGLTTSRNVHLLEAAIAILSDHGYFVEMVSIKAEDLGVAQRRRRILVFARRGKKPFNVTIPTTRQKTVFDAIHKLKQPFSDRPKLLALNSRSRLIAEKIGPGQKLCNVRESAAAVHTWDVPEVFGAVSQAERKVLQTLLRLRRTERARAFGDADPVSIQRIKFAIGSRSEALLRALCTKGYVRRVGAKYDLVHTFNGNYRRLSWDAPSPTVDTHFGDPRLFLHPDEHRGLSVLEAAALQGFDAGFRWPESGKAAFRLIGNAVPPPISKAVAIVARSLMS